MPSLTAIAERKVPLTVALAGEQIDLTYRGVEAAKINPARHRAEIEVLAEQLKDASIDEQEAAGHKLLVDMVVQLVASWNVTDGTEDQIAPLTAASVTRLDDGALKAILEAIVEDSRLSK